MTDGAAQETDPQFRIMRMQRKVNYGRHYDGVYQQDLAKVLDLSFGKTGSQERPTRIRTAPLFHDHFLLIAPSPSYNVWLTRRRDQCV